MSGDRITESYYGARGEADLQRTRERIHWICAQVRGRRVLDVGCSQGITAILLAREGFEVCGVDVDAEALEFARREIGKEPEAVQRRIELVHGSITEVDLPPESFDTALLGEVVEHLVQPERVVEAVCRLLPAGARLVLTTPYGLHESPDHKQTFYVDDLLALVAGWFVPEDLQVVGPYLRLVGRRRDEPGAVSLAAVRAELGEETLRQLVHDATLERERMLRDQLRESTRKRAGHYEALQEARRELDRLRAAPQQQPGAEASAAAQQLEHVLASLRRTQEALQVSEEKRTGHYRVLQKTRRELAVARQRLQLLSASRGVRVVRALSEAKRSPRAALLLLPRLVKVLLRRAPAPPAVPPAPVAQPQAASAPVAPAKRPVDSTPRPGGTTAPAQGERPPARVLLAISEPPALQELRVAAILDDMSAACFAPECQMLTFTPADWRHVLSERPPHLLFVESAWQGNRGSWQYKVARYNHPDAGGLEELVAWCRERGVPTVFWNKEDPVHFEKFHDAARRFDHVFTTDADAVPRYLSLDGSRIRTAAALPFAAQPLLHNPVATGPRRAEPCFAGSYYANRHESRRAMMEMLLDAAREHGLVIYDRNHGNPSPHFRFPERFVPHIVGRLPYDEVVATYRRHQVFLNVNSVEDSPTMLSRRVFELLACGTAVVSTPSRALDELFDGLVEVVHDAESARAVLARLLGDGAYRRDLTRRGWRHVMASHCYEHRFATVARAAGFERCEPVDRRVAVVLPQATAEAAGALLAVVAAQTVPPAEVVLGCAGEATASELDRLAASSAERGPRVRVVRQGDAAPCDAFRELAGCAAAPWVAPLHPSHGYGPHFLEDLVLTTRFAAAEVVGKALPVGPGRGAPEHLYGQPVHPRACLVRRELMAAHGWRDEPAPAPDLVRGSGARGYAADAESFDPAGTGPGT